MNWSLRISLLVMTLTMAVTLGGLGAATSFPYQIIAARNVFKLQPIPPPAPVVQPVPPKVVSKVAVTGLTDICGRKQALVEISEAGRPVVKPLLTEGDRVGLVEVIEIDVENDLVKVRVHGDESVLKLQAPQSSAAPALASRR